MLEDPQYFLPYRKNSLFTPFNFLVIGGYYLGFGLGGILVWLFSNTLLKTFFPKLLIISALIFALIIGLFFICLAFMKTNIRRSVQ